MSNEDSHLRWSNTAKESSSMSMITSMTTRLPWINTWVSADAVLELHRSSLCASKLALKIDLLTHTDIWQRHAHAIRVPDEIYQSPYLDELRTIGNDVVLM